MNFLERLKELCNERGLTIYALEKAIGVSQGCCRKWDKSAPSIDKLIYIADVLNVSLDYLMGREKKSSEIIERPEYAVGIASNLSTDALFIKFSKLYAAAEKELQNKIVTFFEGILFERGYDIKAILGETL